MDHTIGDLSDVERAMQPAVELVLAQDLDWHQARRSFQRALLHAALEQNDGVLYRAAQKLRVGNTALNGLLKTPRDTKIARGRVRNPRARKRQ